jgi:hypothetical protein
MYSLISLHNQYNFFIFSFIIMLYFRLKISKEKYYINILIFNLNKRFFIYHVKFNFLMKTSTF